MAITLTEILSDGQPGSREGLRKSAQPLTFTLSLFVIKLFTSLLIFTICTSLMAADKQNVPIVIGGDEMMDACTSQGAVKGLKPKGDGYLSVRSGPGSQFTETDRLTEGTIFYMCNYKKTTSGSWVRIIYSSKNTSNCGVSSPIKRAITYKGPCKSGWVNDKWVELIAG